MWILGLLALGSANAASLDYPQVSGPFGTPGANDATAAHWNPAGLAMGDGTRFHIEGAPTFASMNIDRDDPYFGGLDQFRLQAVVPFAGVATDFGVKGLGVGASVAVPFAQGVGEGPDGSGSAKYHLQSGMIQSIYVTAAAAYSLGDRFSIGGGVIYVRSSWTATLHTEALTSLHDTMVNQGIDSGYDDSMIENSDYGAELQLSHLSDDRMSFNVGVQVKPIESLTLSLAYTHGVRVDNRGPGEIRMGCPPQSDVLGRLGSESYGLCDATFAANASVSYRLPSRLNGSLVYAPDNTWRVEVMGGWVGWNVYDQFTLKISDVATLNELQKEEAALLLNQTRPQARDAKDSFWVGVDTKVEPFKYVGFGTRVLFDKSAIPTETLSPNNYDADTWVLGGSVHLKPSKKISVILGYSRYFAQQRTVTISNFGVTVDPALRAETAYFYPHARGTYRSSIDRLSLSVRGQFGGTRHEAPSK